MIGALIARDVRRGFTGAAWLPIAFFLLVATLVPFAIGPDARLLGRIAPGALWIAALTAACCGSISAKNPFCAYGADTTTSRRTSSGCWKASCSAAPPPNE